MSLHTTYVTKAHQYITLRWPRPFLVVLCRFCWQSWNKREGIYAQSNKGKEEPNMRGYRFSKLKVGSHQTFPQESVAFLMSHSWRVFFARVWVQQYATRRDSIAINFPIIHLTWCSAWFARAIVTRGAFQLEGHRPTAKP